jgi:DNA-binding LacI/PurR family transcriptional regulator
MNLEEVARRAKVSTATVSRVLNNAELVKNSTRARVMKAVEELKYHPNLHARTLAGGKSRTIGIIVSNLENPFFFDIYKAIEADAHARGYEVVMANTDYRPEQLATSVRVMIGRRVSGLAAVVSEMESELVAELKDSRIPVVLYDVAAPPPHITNIRLNYKTGVDRVVDYLYSLGHRKLGFIGHHATLAPLNERMCAVLQAVSRHSDIEVHTAADSDTLEGGRLAARSLLAGQYGTTAMICVNDIMAVGALRELRETGQRVPRDVSVTGFDNVKLSEFCYPALTTVHIPRERIGHLICDSLIPERGQTPPVDRSIMIDPEFVLRESTGPAPR